MERNKINQKKKTFVLGVLVMIVLVLLIGRVSYLMIYRAEHYTALAEELHERERDIKAKRGRILDASGQVLADNRTVCTISVINSQITEPQRVISTLTQTLGLSEEYVTKRVEKWSAREKIKSNVDKEIGDALRKEEMEGVKIDEDFKRYYPYDELASKVLGFTGSDNQGILGLEVYYDSYLTGEKGQILTVTDAKGVEQEDVGERREEPVAGLDLYTSIDLPIQKYATQLAKQVYATKQAKKVSIIVMNVKNGEILAMADEPEYNLNEPYSFIDEVLTLEQESVTLSEKERQDLLNKMWRNNCIHDTYEPGSVFKIITAATGLETGAVALTDQFYCPGYIIVEDRRIRCAKIAGHGSEDFIHGFMNSCNPVFITVGMRIGVDRFFEYIQKFGLYQKTGIDLPGEAKMIMHKKENVGEVELATVSFGQSFQLTPIRFMTTVSAIINGGTMVTPHFGVRAMNKEKTRIIDFSYPTTQIAVSKETTEAIRMMMEQVVENGGGKNCYIEGYRIGGKTATSQTLPRGTGKYIASFLGTYPANDPQIMAMAIIHEPKGQYYGGQIAAPVIRQLFENILPYLRDKGYN